MEHKYLTQMTSWWACLLRFYKNPHVWNSTLWSQTASFNQIVGVTSLGCKSNGRNTKMDDHKL